MYRGKDLLEILLSQIPQLQIQIKFEQEMEDVEEIRQIIDKF